MLPENPWLTPLISQRPLTHTHTHTHFWLNRNPSQYTKLPLWFGRQTNPNSNVYDSIAPQPSKVCTNGDSFNAHWTYSAPSYLLTSGTPATVFALWLTSRARRSVRQNTNSSSSPTTSMPLWRLYCVPAELKGLRLQISLRTESCIIRNAGPILLPPHYIKAVHNTTLWKLSRHHTVWKLSKPSHYIKAVTAVAAY